MSGNSMEHREAKEYMEDTTVDWVCEEEDDDCHVHPSTNWKIKHITITEDEDYLKQFKRHKKHRLVSPSTPAAYPSSIPIRSDCSDDESTEIDDEFPLPENLNTDNKIQGSSTVYDVGIMHDNVEKSIIKKTAVNELDEDIDKSPNDSSGSASKNISHDESFFAFRMHYLIVHIAIMLADGLQGTHLYVLYEGYGYTVASLYCLGFVSGALTSPFIGPLVDKIGRRNSAIVYCALEIGINLLEQYSVFAGLVVSRVVGGVTTNLLFTVFESWLVTEHRKRGFSSDELETILRDSVVVSNLSAIASGCIAHYLASWVGPTGPFEGAVACTVVALVLVSTRWEENYGSDVPGVKSISNYMSNAFTTITSDSCIFRIGLIQGLTEGALQTFVFLWSPALLHFARKLQNTSTTVSTLGLDSDGEPAYGLIFGAFMACGAMGGMLEPTARKAFISFFGLDHNTSANELSIREKVNLFDEDKGGFRSDESKENCDDVDVTMDGCVSDSSALTCQTDDVDSELLTSNEKEGSLTGKLVATDATANTADSSDMSIEPRTEDEKPVAVDLLAAISFFICAALLSTPVILADNNPYAFTISLVSFLFYECVVGFYMPCEAVLRTWYMPNDSICSLMTMLRVIVNVAVALGVISTNYIPFTAAFAACSGALIIAGCLQLSLVDKQEWTLFVGSISRRIGLQQQATSDDQLKSCADLKEDLKEIDLRNLSTVPFLKRMRSLSSSPDTSMTSCSDDEQLEFKPLLGLRQRHVPKIAE